jgi:translation initiation factor 2B subunit (eIF-2B alpha/beta/delta family)
MVIDITVEDIENLKTHCEARIKEVYAREDLTLQEKADQARAFNVKIENLLLVITDSKIVRDSGSL